MKTPSSTAPKPVMANQANGTLKGPKGNFTDTSKGTAEMPSGLHKAEPQACLDTGGKSCID